MGSEHRLEITEETMTVGVFDNSIPPVMAVESGDVVDIETATHWGDAITPETTLEDVIELNTKKFPDVGPHTLTGPVEVRGAKAGQTLKVDVLELVLRDHGFNLFYPGEFGTGLLPEDYDTGNMHHFAHDLDAMTTTFGDRVTIPLDPFLGIMGVAPEEPGQLLTIPPGPHGGNMDLPRLNDGATVYLPIWQDGAQFSIGDAHSKQGNGEVCLTAIETAMVHSKLRLSVIDDWQLERPCAETADSWITMGFHEDLLEAAKTAVRDMIALLGVKYEIKRKDAYNLCSILGDLSVTQVVNRQRGIHVEFPKSVFDR